MKTSMKKQTNFETAWFLSLLQHPPRGLPGHLNLTFPAVQIPIPLHQYGTQMPYYSARFDCRITHQRGSAKTVDYKNSFAMTQCDV